VDAPGPSSRLSRVHECAYHPRRLAAVPWRNEMDRTGKRGVRIATLGALLLLLLASCDNDPAHDPAEWTGAPWRLVEGPLPDDRASIRAWFQSVDDPSISTLPPFTIAEGQEVVLQLSFIESGGQGSVRAASVLPNADGFACDPNCETHLSGCDPCIAADMLRAVVAEREPVIASLDQSPGTWFVADAIDVGSAGSHETIAQLWFAQPNGSWVFKFDASNVDDVEIAAEAMADALAVGS
jgi:hypothetical protein